VVDWIAADSHKMADVRKHHVPYHLHLFNNTRLCRIPGICESPKEITKQGDKGLKEAEARAKWKIIVGEVADSRLRGLLNRLRGFETVGGCIADNGYRRL